MDPCRLLKRQYEPLIIVDASLIYEINDKPQLETLIDEQVIQQAPAKTDADYFVIQTADEYNTFIISNDQYEAYQNDHPWIEKRRVPLMIIKGEPELYEPKLAKNCPQT